ncbi:MAG: hypothetical protein PVJ53_03345 [Desulfobacterales bacterium]|jgi:hypothetical protein
MSDRVKIYQVGDFIRMTESGELDRDRSIKIVRDLATAANFHKDHNILLDLRETDSQASMHDLIDIAMEFATYHELFRNKIAVLIPNTEERLQLANRFKACMDLQGFQFEKFSDFEAAIEWLAWVR